MNDPDRVVAWPAGLEDELPSTLWVPSGLTADDDPGGGSVAGGLVNLAFIGEALRRKAILWCVTAVLGLVAGTGLYVAYPPAYHAQTQVLLVDAANQDPAVEVLTDQSLALSEPVAASVVQQLHLPQSVASLRAAYSVTPITDTVLLFDVGALTSADAVQRASALADSYLKYRAKYAQTQEEQQKAQLDQQYSAAEQRVRELDAEIGQLPTTDLTSAQKIQLDTLQTELADQKQVMQYATGTEAATKASTAAMVSDSYVLNPATPLARSRVKGAALYVLGGLFGGLVVGMAIVIVGALLSGKLRRRDDVAAVLGAPVRLSIGDLRAPRLLERSRRRARRNRDMNRLASYLKAAAPGSPRGPASLAVVAADDARTVAAAVALLARSLASEGKRVIAADLTDGAPLARLLGAGRDAGLHDVTLDNTRILVAVPGRDEVAPVGPVRGGGSPSVWGQPDPAVAAAYSDADLLLTLATLDPGVGGDHLATWAAEAIVVVTAGLSTVEQVHSVGEMVRLAGTRLDSAVLLGADRSDVSLGNLDRADDPYRVGAGQRGAPDRGTPE